MSGKSFAGSTRTTRTARSCRFNREHAFPTGNPAPAYEIQLEGQLETMWLGERVVEKGMVAAQSK